ncbi:MAG: hypothetical protein HC903_16785 [Methylacidiphilales bacterium]|nr:hypothetical protein [Candidatus Methylacidiphilales bacterium]NJR18116.1 hypothetical protein [Calothrix sp. CSU_2_0]
MYKLLTKSFLKLLPLSLSTLTLPINAAPIPFGQRDYIQHRANQPNFGAATTQEGCVNHLQSNGGQEAFVKTMWLTFDTLDRNQWLESGCTKSLTATSITIPNPNIDDVSFFEGHYFAYNTYVNVPGQTQPQSRYHEGRVNIGTVIPSGNHRYKIERDITQNNRWCNAVNNVASYCITLPGVDNYNAAGYITVGIESRDTSHTFTNNTRAENIWYRPVSNSGFIRLPNMLKRDNMATSRTWSSSYTSATSTIPDRIIFKNQP